MAQSGAFAEQAKIIYAEHLDERIIKRYLVEPITSLYPKVLRYHQRTIESVSLLVYFVLSRWYSTKKRTLGEEHAGIVPWKETNIASYEALFNYSFVRCLLEVGLPILLPKIIEERKQREKLTVAFELLNEVHLALFYFTGSYFPFLKRLFCIRYVVDEQTGEGYPRLLFKLVGLSVLLRAIFNEKYRMVLFQRQDREHKDKVKVMKRALVVDSVKDFRVFRKDLVKKGLTHGFVPTMGCLHRGHLALVKEAKKVCDTVSVSIFVNPSQFAPHEDFDKYPRMFEQDLKMLNDEGVDAVLVPSVKEMYPSGITLKVDDQRGTFVSVQGLSHQLEGSVRSHFFRGVATVVTKLFNIVQPDKAFFGQKDIQQCVVIRNMVKDLLLPIDVVICDTVREHDGLAMSSRNRYLSKEERSIAPILYQSMKLSESAYNAKAFKRHDILSPGITNLLKEKKLSVDYYNLSDMETLEEIDESPEGKPAILSAAIRVGKTRLIDNIILGKRT